MIDFLEMVISILFVFLLYYVLEKHFAEKKKLERKEKNESIQINK